MSYVKDASFHSQPTYRQERIASFSDKVSSKKKEKLKKRASGGIFQLNLRKLRARRNADEDLVQSGTSSTTTNNRSRQAATEVINTATGGPKARGKWHSPGKSD